MKLFSLLNQDNYSILEQEKLRYGIQIILAEFYKVVLIYLIAFFMESIVPTLIIHITFLFLRQVCLGYHFSNLYVCIATSIITFPLVSSYLIKFEHTFLNNYIFILFGIFIFLVYILGPRGTENQPIISKEHHLYLRKKMKRRLIIIVIAYCISSPELRLLLTYGVFLEVIMLVTQTLKERVVNESKKEVV